MNIKKILYIQNQWAKKKKNHKNELGYQSPRNNIWINTFHLLLEYKLKKSPASSTHKYEKDCYYIQWTFAHTYIDTLKGKVGHTLTVKTYWLVQENVLLPF